MRDQATQGVVSESDLEGVESEGEGGGRSDALWRGNARPAAPEKQEGEDQPRAHPHCRAQVQPLDRALAGDGDGTCRTRLLEAYK